MIIINNLINNNIKYFYIVAFFVLYIIFIFLLNKIKHENLLYTDKIYFKGNLTLKKNLIKNYLSRVSDEYKSAKIEENLRFNNFFNLAVYSNNSIIKSALKDKILKEISNLKNQTVNHLDTFFFKSNMNFGNSVIQVNNAIFYCEVIGCNNIILNNTVKRKWLISEEIFIKKLNITIKQGSNVDCENTTTLCIFENSFPFYPKVLIPQIRTDLIKDEILRNLPNVSIDSDALYIHIRGGDIFLSYFLLYYSQPPLCFYERLINNTKFKKFYIVSMDTANIVVNILTKKYSNVIHNINSMEYDISLLSHAFHVALSVSSFVISAIKINDNLKDIWEYDIMRLTEKLLFLHHHLYKFKIKYTIHTMKPSDSYVSKMFVWGKKPEQIKLMLEDNCHNDFIVTNPNI